MKIVMTMNDDNGIHTVYVDSSRKEIDTITIEDVVYDVKESYERNEQTMHENPMEYYRLRSMEATHRLVVEPRPAVVEDTQFSTFQSLCESFLTEDDPTVPENEDKDNIESNPADTSDDKDDSGGEDEEDAGGGDEGESGDEGEEDAGGGDEEGGEEDSGDTSGEDDVGGGGEEGEEDAGGGDEEGGEEEEGGEDDSGGDDDFGQYKPPNLKVDDDTKKLHMFNEINNKYKGLKTILNNVEELKTRVFNPKINQDIDDLEFEIRRVMRYVGFILQGNAKLEYINMRVINNFLFKFFERVSDAVDKITKAVQKEQS